MKIVLKYIMLATTLIGIAIGILAVSSAEEDQEEHAAGYELLVSKKDSERWIYEVYQNKKLIIRQERIPAVEGTYYFTKKEDAVLVGSLVIKKLKESKTPSLTEEELKNLNILSN